MNNKIIIIDCYANHEEKYKILRECIAKLKLLGHHIMVTSHSVLPEDIVRSVNYYIYDHDNTFSDVYGLANWWFANYHYEIHVNVRPPAFSLKGHEYPIIRAIRNALNLAIANGYDTFCFTEFDNIFSDSDLVKIDAILNDLNPRDKKFFFFEVGNDDTDKCIETCFFAGYSSDFLKIFNLYFPSSIEVYNEIFSKKYPFNLERFFYEMMRSHVNHFKPVRAVSATYFDGDGKNISHVQDAHAWILSDHSGGYYIVVSNHNKQDYKIKITIDGQVVHENKFCGVVYPALKLKSEGNYIVEYFSITDILLKTITINFDLSNKLDYDAQGIIKFKNI